MGICNIQLFKNILSDFDLQVAYKYFFSFFTISIFGVFNVISKWADFTRENKFSQSGMPRVHPISFTFVDFQIVPHYQGAFKYKLKGP